MDPAAITRFPTAAYASIRKFLRAHRFWSLIIAATVLYGGYWGYTTLTATPSVTHYVTTTVATGTVVATMAETGQVSASQQLALTPKASGTVTGVYVSPGATVYAGQIIAQLDATNALQSLRNAQLALKNQQLSYQQTTSSSTLALNLLTAQNAVTNAVTSLQKTHDASYASLTNIYSDLSGAITNLDHYLHDKNVPGRTTQANIDAFADTVSQNDYSIGIYKSSAQTSYDTAYAAYQTALTAYRATPIMATNDDLLALADKTYTAAQAVAEGVKNTRDFFDRIQSDYSLSNLKTSTTLTGLVSASAADAATVNNDLSTSLTMKSNIVSAEQTLAQAKDTLQSTQGGSNTLTVQQATLALQQAQDAVANAEQTVTDYTVYAPFNGTVASVGVHRYDQASSGTTIATLVAHQQTVDISVNEVDAAKLKVGQKATLSFDALPDVTVAGTVSSLNTIGAVTQGVVSYDAIVTFDTPNSKVKPGMSSTVSIVSGVATGLIVPASAIKTSGTENYVEVFTPPLAGSESAGGAPSATHPSRVPVTIGLASDTDVIVLQGLTAGVQAVIQTIAGTATQKTAAPSIFSAAGARGAGGGRAGRTGG